MGLKDRFFGGGDPREERVQDWFKENYDENLTGIEGFGNRGYEDVISIQLDEPLDPTVFSWAMDAYDLETEITEDDSDRHRVVGVYNVDEYESGRVSKQLAGTFHEETDIPLSENPVNEQGEVQTERVDMLKTYLQRKHADEGERLEFWIDDHYSAFPDGIEQVWRDGSGLTLEEPVDVQRFADVMEDEGYRVEGGHPSDESVSVMEPITFDGEQRGWGKYGGTFHADKDVNLGVRNSAIWEEGEPAGDTVEGTLDLLTTYLEAEYGGKV